MSSLLILIANVAKRPGSDPKTNEIAAGPHSKCKQAHTHLIFFRFCMGIALCRSTSTLTGIAPKRRMQHLQNIGPTTPLARGSPAGVLGYIWNKDQTGTHCVRGSPHRCALATFEISRNGFCVGIPAQVRLATLGMRIGRPRALSLSTIWNKDLLQSRLSGDHPQVHLETFGMRSSGKLTLSGDPPRCT